MLVLFAMMLAGQGAPSPTCAPDQAGTTMKAAVAQYQARQFAAAETLLAPIVDCPITNDAVALAQIMAADLAARKAEWPRVRALTTRLGFHPETRSGALAQFLAMRADQALNDPAAFATDRALLLAANDARLTAGGEKIETFPVPGGVMSAYRTTVNQGSFKRLYEFVATPEDAAAYPVTIMLTDDAMAAGILRQLGSTKDGEGSPPAFLDLYTCTGHQTLPPVAGTNGSAPAYAAIKARVVDALSRPGALAATPPPATGVCSGASWLVPGFDVKTR